MLADFLGALWVGIQGAAAYFAVIFVLAMLINGGAWLADLASSQVERVGEG